MVKTSVNKLIAAEPQRGSTLILTFARDSPEFTEPSLSRGTMLTRIWIWCPVSVVLSDCRNSGGQSIRRLGGGGSNNIF